MLPFGRLRKMETIITSLQSRLDRIPRELRLFIAASFIMGIGYAVMDSVFNNYLNERFALTGFQRSFLELPREFPGFLVLFVSALLWFLCSRRIGVLSMVMGALSVILIGFLSPTYTFMVGWLFVYSLGQHLFIPAGSAIGIDLAKEGRVGRRLGQLNSVRNLSAVLGALIVFLGFKFLGFTFHSAFIVSALAFTVAAVLMFAMKPEKTQLPKMFFKLRREYSLYYILAVLYGSRKQLFLTFGPWVVVSVFHQPTQTIAILLFIGGCIGIVFQPILGHAIDRLGERTILIWEAILLVFVCLGYGFSKSLFSEFTAFLIVCACFLLDQMLMSVNMARTTYIRKITRHPDHLQAALTSSVSIDHIFSITIALVSGILWSRLGFQYVFLMGAFIAVANFVAALFVRIPTIAGVADNRD
jgi:predicted MFS family arabinose efflux permease